MTYMIVSASLALDLTGATEYWYLEDPSSCLEYNGFRCPGFSNSFFYSVVGAVDCACMMLGSVAFSTLMKHWTYVHALNVSQVLLVAVSLLDVAMFERWNRHAGIPDWVFMLGKSAVQNTIAQMNFLPGTLLISKLCPKGIETTVFAMLAAYHNFGMAVAGYVSSYLFTLVPGLGEVDGKCGTSGGAQCCTGPGCSCSDGCDDFSQLWKMSMLAACLPLITIVLNYLFIPNIPMSSHTEWDETTGSLCTKDPEPLDVELSAAPPGQLLPGHGGCGEEVSNGAKQMLERLEKEEEEGEPGEDELQGSELTKLLGAAETAATP